MKTDWSLTDNRSVIPMKRFFWHDIFLGFLKLPSIYDKKGIEQVHFLEKGIDQS